MVKKMVCYMEKLPCPTTPSSLRSVDLITHSPEASGCENREPRFFKRSVAAAGIQVGRLLRAFSRRHSASLPHNGRAALLFYLSFRCRRQLGELGAQSP